MGKKEIRCNSLKTKKRQDTREAVRAGKNLEPHDVSGNRFKEDGKSSFQNR